MLVNLNKNRITVFAMNFSYLLQCSYLLNDKICSSLQDQNQGPQLATRMHYGRMG